MRLSRVSFRGIYKCRHTVICKILYILDKVEIILSHNFIYVKMLRIF